jgi:hypothetical protein
MGRQQLNRGKNFERRVARMFRAHGFQAQRVNESDGFNVGSDIQLYYEFRPFSPDHPQIRFKINVAIQCKCTKDPADLARGFVQAMEGQPSSEAWICIHSCNRHLTCRYHTRVGCPRDVTFEELIPLLWTHCPISRSAT